VLPIKSAMLRYAFRRRLLFVSLIIVFGAWPQAAPAQLLTQHVKGAVGLKSGSQPPPGGYVPLPIVYFYNTDTVKDRNGDRLPGNADLTSSFFGVGYSQVTTKKILGGFYGFAVLFPVGANNRIQGTEIDANPGAGFTDSAFTPISLGWHRTRADFIASFNIFAPTGKYTDGADDNTGLGMWGFEPLVGTTVYLDGEKRYHAAAELAFDFQSKKEDSETKVGNQMNVDGGVGADFLKGGLSTGLAYYASFKLSDDEIEGLPGILIRGKNRVFGLGPEATLAIAAKNKVYGFVTVRYFWELYARTTTQGSSFLIQGTLLTKPVTVPGA
jgi:hypothetical protein